MSAAWHLLTGEYPPRRGGVADYTARLARALAERGREVHVWCPPPADEPSAGEGVRVHPLPEGFRPAGLRCLSEALDALPAPRTLLVQYAPQAFGMRGMNLPFCRWVRARSRAGDEVRVMFHEPFFPFGWQRPRRNLLAAVNRAMAALLLAASRVAYVSIPAWEALLRPWTGRGRPMRWLPVPSTLPRVGDPGRVAEIRTRLTGGDPSRRVVGHFGTYGALLAPGVARVFAALLEAEPEVVALFLGGGGDAFAAELRQRHPVLEGRVAAPGFLAPEELSLHLQASDLILQPYPDGASSRRTTLMAALAHGLATVTTTGRFTEPVWSEDPRLPLVPADRPEAMVQAARRLLADPAARVAAGQAGAALYESHFAMDRTVATLLEESPHTFTRSPAHPFTQSPRHPREDA